MTDYAKAMRMAAEQIRSHPERYDFWSTQPPGPGCRACAIGWIAKMIGRKTALRDGINWFVDDDGLIIPYRKIVQPIIQSMRNDRLKKTYAGPEDAVFYSHMDRVAKGWKYDAQKAANGLEALADEIDGGDLTNARRMIAEAIAADLPQVVAA